MKHLPVLIVIAIFALSTVLPVATIFITFVIVGAIFSSVFLDNDRKGKSLHIIPQQYFISKKKYLRSPEYRAKRIIVLKRDNYTCRGCGTTEQLEVHHTTYKRLGNEKLTDLVTVCRNCHQRIHDKYGYNYKSEFPLIKD